MEPLPLRCPRCNTFATTLLCSSCGVEIDAVHISRERKHLVFAAALLGFSTLYSLMLVAQATSGDMRFPLAATDCGVVAGIAAGAALYVARMAFRARKRPLASAISAAVIVAVAICGAIAGASHWLGFDWLFHDGVGLLILIAALAVCCAACLPARKVERCRNELSAGSD